MLKVFVSQRDNLFLLNYLRKLDFIEIVEIQSHPINLFVENLVNHKVDLVIQISPQWEWGKYVEIVSRDIMKAGVKLLSGEGAMFRSYGEDFQCGSDVGFYLSPWGYSGNSKISRKSPSPSMQDIEMAKVIMAQQTKWSDTENNGKYLVIGQLDYDRSKFYARDIKTNEQLIVAMSKLFKKDEFTFRPHPLDETDYSGFNIDIQMPIEKLSKIIHSYKGLISVNSTSTIEGMCSGMPIFNFEVAPWSACKVVSVGNVPKWSVFCYEEYIYDVASLIHLHYLNNYNYGDPLQNALNFYSEFDDAVFNYNCIQNSELPQIWDEKYRDLSK